MHHRTSMNIPEDLLKEAVRASGATTRTMAVVMGLEELIRKKRLEKLLQLKGLGALRLSQKKLAASRRR
ncbi:MAG: type II toxin-antitoxin system VapB family antitoxin [Deltaproteobacteria bacterium]|nr:type II toxin-antitoxin system VapB family antitoxin [Deltaproteobacteria bacterium]